MPQTPDDTIATQAEDAAIEAEYPSFDADSVVEPADDGHVTYDQEAGPSAPVTAPARRKKTAYIMVVAAVLIVAAAAFHFMHHKTPVMSPEMASIAHQANAVPAKAEQAIAPRSAKPVSHPPHTAVAPAPAAGTPIAAATVAAPQPLATPKTTTASVPTQAHAGVAPASLPATAASSSPAASNLVPTETVDASKYHVIVQERDDALARINVLTKQLADAEKAADAKPKVRVVQGVGHMTVRAVLKDGVVLQGPNGKTIIAPNGARISVTPHSAHIDH